MTRTCDEERDVDGVEIYLLEVESVQWVELTSPDGSLGQVMLLLTARWTG